MLNKCIQLQTGHPKNMITCLNYTGCNMFTYKAPRDILKITQLYMNTTGDYGILFNIDKPKLRLHVKKKEYMES
jgi:hypothetical protein